MKTIVAFLVSILTHQVYSQTGTQKVTTSNMSQDFIDLETELARLPVLVKTVNTCSTTPEECGYMAFGSSTLVIVLEGKYKNQKLYVSAVCRKTNYATNALYTLYFENEPDFGAVFCNDQKFTPNWNRESKGNYPMVYGNLKD